MPRPSPSRRAPTQARARATVDALLDAAAEVIEERGFDGATTERIVARAGVSVGSMYQYFPDKGALVAALVRRLAEDAHALQLRWVRLLEGGASLDDGLSAFVAWLVAAHAVRPRLRCLLFESGPLPAEHRARMHGMHTTTETALRRWLEGKVRQPTLTAHLLSASIPPLVHQFVLHPRPELPPEAAIAEIQTMARAYLDAVAQPTTDGGTAPRC